MSNLSKLKSTLIGSVGYSFNHPELRGGFEQLRMLEAMALKQKREAEREKLVGFLSNAKTIAEDYKDSLDEAISDLAYAEFIVKASARRLYQHDNPDVPLVDDGQKPFADDDHEVLCRMKFL